MSENLDETKAWEIQLFIVPITRDHADKLFDAILDTAGDECTGGVMTPLKDGREEKKDDGA